MKDARRALRGVARERVRREIETLLLAPGVAAGIALLRRTGLEAELAPGAREDGGALVAALPPDLPLRLAAWLRGTQAESILLRLRFPRRVVAIVARLVALHPIDARRLRGDADVRRLVRRVGETGIAELAAAARVRDPRRAANPPRSARRFARCATASSACSAPANSRSTARP